VNDPARHLCHIRHINISCPLAALDLSYIHLILILPLCLGVILASLLFNHMIILPLVSRPQVNWSTSSPGPTGSGQLAQVNWPRSSSTGQLVNNHVTIPYLGQPMRRTSAASWPQPCTLCTLWRDCRRRVQKANFCEQCPALHEAIWYVVGFAKCQKEARFHWPLLSKVSRSGNNLTCNRI